MDRRNFLKAVGVGAAVVAVPISLSAAPPKYSGIPKDYVPKHEIFDKIGKTNCTWTATSRDPGYLDWDKQTIYYTKHKTLEVWIDGYRLTKEEARQWCPPLERGKYKVTNCKRTYADGSSDPGWVVTRV